MTGKEWAMDKLMMEEEKLIKKFCPGDFGITTEESKKCKNFAHPGACRRCWESEVVK